VTEQEIIKEHDGAVKFVGQRLYQFFLPLLEIHEALARILQMNREMYKLKEDEKKQPAPIKQGAKRGGKSFQQPEPPEAA